MHSKALRTFVKAMTISPLGTFTLMPIIFR